MDAPHSAEAMPAVSIVVPVYKVEKYLPECIESILVQTFEDFEMILVDDGSPDNSGKICDDYAARDPRIRVFHKENGGVTSARRLGVERSRAEWIMFVDSDDKLFPNALRDLLDAVNSHPDADLAEAEMTRDETAFLSSPTGPGSRSVLCATGLEYAVAVASLKMVWLSGPVAKIIRKSVLISANALDVPAWITFGEDLMMCIRLARRARKTVRIPATIYFYRSNPTGASATIRRTAKYYADWLAECERAVGGIDGAWGDVWRAVARKYFIGMFLVCGDWHPRDPYMRKIVRELSRRSRKYSAGTRLCLVAAKLPHPLQSLARAALSLFLFAKLRYSNVQA